jgi:hypothetical protein
VAITITRRDFLRGTAAVAGVAAAGLGAHSLFIEPHDIATERVDIRLPRLPDAFDGFRIVQISDIHYGPYLGRRGLQAALDAAIACHPDAVALTGDFVSHPLGGRNGPEGARHAEPCADVLRQFAPVPVFAVLGNHDHWNSATIVAGAFHDAGLQMLRNQALPLERGAARLWIAGLDDAWTGAADLPHTLRQVPADEATVLLAHEPDIADYVARFPIDLQLSGHSHGGQVRLPGIGPIILPWMAKKYPEGLNRVGDLQVYTNRGIGVIAPPVRFNCPPEVTLITLRAGRLAG